MPNEILNQITQITSNTKQHKINWIQENFRTYYALRTDEDNNDIQLSIQYIPNVAPEYENITTKLNAFLGNPRFVLQIKNVENKEIIYKLIVEKGSEGFEELGRLFSSIKEIEEQKAKTKLDLFISE